MGRLPSRLRALRYGAWTSVVAGLLALIAFAPPLGICLVLVLPNRQAGRLPALAIAGVLLIAVGAALHLVYRLKLDDHEAAHCRHCGYPLRGLPVGERCPECGRRQLRTRRRRGLRQEP